MTSILAYCDPISPAPGESVQCMVSCEGASRYRADIVRLVNPEAGPQATAFRYEAVDSPVNGEYTARRQALYPGSYGIVAPHHRVEQLTSFTVQTYVWPTTPGGRRPGLLGAGPYHPPPPLTIQSHF